MRLSVFLLAAVLILGVVGGQPANAQDDNLQSGTSLPTQDVSPGRARFNAIAEKEVADLQAAFPCAEIAAVALDQGKAQDLSALSDAAGSDVYQGATIRSGLCDENADSIWGVATVIRDAGSGSKAYIVAFLSRKDPTSMAPAEAALSIAVEAATTCAQEQGAGDAQKVATCVRGKLPEDRQMLAALLVRGGSVSDYIGWSTGGSSRVAWQTEFLSDSKWSVMYWIFVLAGN